MCTSALAPAFAFMCVLFVVLCIRMCSRNELAAKSNKVKPLDSLNMHHCFIFIMLFVMYRNQMENKKRSVSVCAYAN